MAKIFDFEERAAQFARDLFSFLAKLPKSGPNIDLADQLYRSGPSVGANYVESCDASGKKDRLMKLRTSRREASETKFNLGLLICPRPLTDERDYLIQEAKELRDILSAMIRKNSS